MKHFLFCFVSFCALKASNTFAFPMGRWQAFVEVDSSAGKSFSQLVTLSVIPQEDVLKIYAWHRYGENFNIWYKIKDSQLYNYQTGKPEGTITENRIEFSFPYHNLHYVIETSGEKLLTYRTQKYYYPNNNQWYTHTANNGLLSLCNNEFPWHTPYDYCEK